MSREDVPPLPETVPRKRRQIESLLDVHIAMWLAGEQITRGERLLLEREKERRKALQPTNELGVLVGQEGMTPEQFGTLKELVDSYEKGSITGINHPGVASKVHQALKALDVEVKVLRDVRNEDAALVKVVRASDRVIATPKERVPGNGGVWSGIKLARHRSIPVAVIFTDGTIERS